MHKKYIYIYLYIHIYIYILHKRLYVVAESKSNPYLLPLLSLLPGINIIGQRLFGTVSDIRIM